MKKSGGKVRACPNCGSRDLRIQRARGTIPQLYCIGCLSQVLPVYFDSEEARARFAESRKKAQAQG